MRALHATFYLDQEEVGQCEIPTLPLGVDAASCPQSIHWISPYTGRIWASLSLDGCLWATALVPAPGEPESRSRVPGHLMLTFHLGDIYESPDTIRHFPPAFLRLDFEAEYGLWKGYSR